MTLTQLRGLLDARLAELEASLPLWGIRQDHPEASFIRSQIDSHRVLAEMIRVNSEQTVSAQKELHAVEYQLGTTALRVESAMKARVEEIQHDVEQVVARTVERAGDDLAKTIVKWAQIRELRWNFWTNWTRVAAVTGVVFLLVLGGYMWRAADDTGATDGLWECEHGHLLIGDTAKGPSLMCPLQDFVDPGTFRGMRAKFMPEHR